jgi:filamentous hemagglutinin family protein
VDGRYRIKKTNNFMRSAHDNRSLITIGLITVCLVGTHHARAGEGDILKQVVSPALALQRAALANQAQTTQALQALQALQAATQTYQASGIRGGGVMVNASHNPAADPRQILGSVRADGKVYVIDRNGIIFGGPRQINTHELTEAAMGATSNSVTELEKFQRSVTKPKENPSLIKVDVLGYGGKN